MCSGGEETLLECPRSYRSGEMLVGRELGDSDCSHEEDAGVRCDGESVSVKKKLLHPLPACTLQLLCFASFVLAFQTLKQVALAIGGF